MPNFIDRLSDRVELNRAELRETLTKEARPEERELQRLVKKHWHRLPKATGMPKRPAYAVDGSRALRHLANSAYFFVAQALIVGEHDGQHHEDTQVDVKILPGATPPRFVEPFAELMMHRLEANLASGCIKEIPRDSVVFLDGTIYGQLTQLFRTDKDDKDPVGEDVKERIKQMVTDILESYGTLFNACRKGLTLLSIAKTSHEVVHSRVWCSAEGGDPDNDIPKIADTEIIYQWTGRQAGFSTPILLGEHSFSRGGSSLLDDENVKQFPAIISFFVRLADFDDALRIDLPACCIVGHNETIGDIKTNHEKVLDQPADLAAIEKIMNLLLSDYGGPEVYNALMYSVDREVRLHQDMTDQVYLSLIRNMLDLDEDQLRLDRSERRFHARQ